MYYVKKGLAVSASHRLKLNYESKCENLHGHNWNINIYLKSEELDENWMVMDFTIIKKSMKNKIKAIATLAAGEITDESLNFAKQLIYGN